MKGNFQQMPTETWHAGVEKKRKNCPPTVIETKNKLLETQTYLKLWQREYIK